MEVENENDDTYQIKDLFGRVYCGGFWIVAFSSPFNSEIDYLFQPTPVVSESLIQYSIEICVQFFNFFHSE